jgi:hypothetical protein
MKSALLSSGCVRLSLLLIACGGSNGGAEQPGDSAPIAGSLTTTAGGECRCEHVYVTRDGDVARVDVPAGCRRTASEDGRVTALPPCTVAPTPPNTNRSTP